MNHNWADIDLGNTWRASLTLIISGKELKRRTNSEKFTINIQSTKLGPDGRHCLTFWQNKRTALYIRHNFMTKNVLAVGFAKLWVGWYGH